MKKVVSKKLFLAAIRERDAAKAELQKIHDDAAARARKLAEERKKREIAAAEAARVFVNFAPQKQLVEKKKCLHTQKVGLTALGKLQQRALENRIMLRNGVDKAGIKLAQKNAAGCGKRELAKWKEVPF